jgi:hypothetical protein
LDASIYLLELQKISTKVVDFGSQNVKWYHLIHLGSGSFMLFTPIDVMLLRLGIEEEEIDDLIFEEEESVPKEVKWMALAKVNTTILFSP